MDLSILTNGVITLTKSVGDFIRREAILFDPSKIEYKGLNDMVSYVDKTAEIQLVSGLSKLLPAAGFITEEGTAESSDQAYTWIIDPLDGTTNFIHGIPTFAVSIALYFNHEPLIGVVYEVNRDECFYAWKEGGSYLNGKSISVSARQNISSSLLATGFPYYDFEKQQPYLRVFNDLMQKCHGLRRIGSAAVDLAYVAAGRFDGYFEYNLKSWDVAAGALIVQEAGGTVMDFAGGKDFIDKKELIASNNLIAGELLAAIKKEFN